MTKEEEKKKAGRMLLQAFLAVLAAGLILVFALVLILRPGSAEDTVSPAAGSGEEEPETEEEIPEDEDPQERQAEEAVKGAEAELPKIKEVPGENSDVTLGIDVSRFQEDIDWKQVAESGVDFAMVRIGYRKSVSGTIVEDECARYNMQEAAANGIHLGAYFFSTAVNEEEALEEARWVCEFLKGYPVTYPVVYNCEGFQEDYSRQHDMTVEERSALAGVFLDEIEAAGYTGMFYASRGELADSLLWDTETLEQRYRIWVAQYLPDIWPEVTEPEYDGSYVMWQYTDQGTVPGIRTVVDLNVAYFGYDAAASALEEGAAERVEVNLEAGVTFEEVNEQVTSKDVTNLRSTMRQGDGSNVAAKLRNGETATRTGVGNNGWSRVEYEGQTLYAVSSYLTTDLGCQTPAEEPDDGFKTKFTPVTENVTAKDVTNLRDRPSVEEPSAVVVQLHNGEVIARTGVSEPGWSRVEYNGQTLYCISSYLEVVE